MVKAEQVLYSSNLTIKFQCETHDIWYSNIRHYIYSLTLGVYIENKLNEFCFQVKTKVHYSCLAGSFQAPIAYLSHKRCLETS